MTAERHTGSVDFVPEENRGGSAQVREWLGQLLAQNGSDLLLVSHVPAAIRVEGVLSLIGDHPLTAEEIEAAMLPALAAHAREEYQQYGIADSSYRVEGLGRFRINLHRERGRAAATLRALPSKVPTRSEERRVGKE